ncbi:MAG: hypothetical protein QF560_17270, partial [SAR324 cluster bacterium]|nr:hypothetical protein [SAR324 cluster bacterium]
FINRKNTDEPGPRKPLSLLFRVIEVISDTKNRLQHRFSTLFEKKPFFSHGILQNLNPTGFRCV